MSDATRTAKLCSIGTSAIQVVLPQFGRFFSVTKINQKAADQFIREIFGRIIGSSNGKQLVTFLFLCRTYNGKIIQICMYRTAAQNLRLENVLSLQAHSDAHGPMLRTCDHQKQEH